MYKEKKRIKSFDDLPLFLTVSDISNIMGLSRVKSYELTNRLPVIRVGRRITIPKSAFLKWIEIEASKEK